MSEYTITMPHRYVVRYQDDRSIVDYEVELEQDGIALYCHSPKTASGLPADTDAVVKAIEAWLRENFNHVSLDKTPPPPETTMS